MPPVNCIIVDDEPIARTILQQYIDRDERLQLTNCYKSASEALKEMQTAQSLLVFLDINMPKISGFEMLRSLLHPPHVIFTTAYRDYALEGFNLNAIDYLLKPYSFERFLQAVNKACMLISPQQDVSLPAAPPEHVFVKCDGKLVRVNMEDILFVEALKEYVKIHTIGGSYITYQTMQNMEEKLPSLKFFRIHRSYLVAIKYVQMIEGNMVVINKVSIPISRNCKDQFLERIATNRLL
jgi:DNA-binding LytR/AlgR family response regulator